MSSIFIAVFKLERKLWSFSNVLTRRIPALTFPSEIGVRRLSFLISRFARDESGAFAMLFGLMAIFLVALTGAVVDYTSMEEKRNRAQIALDAAALALQPRIYTDTPDQIRAAAAALVAERLNNGEVASWVTGIVIDPDEGTLELTGGIRVPMNFVRLVGVDNLEARLVAEVTRKKLALEVVMVLDNSGSMLDQNRMTYLKQAAACASRTLFYEEVDANCQPVAGAGQVEDVRIGIVPFTMYVNVGAQNQNAYWLDWSGLAPVSKDNFEVINGRVNRLGLFDNLKRTNNLPNAWAGCVVAREYPLDTNDTPPATGNPPANPETLFTPLFVPDSRDGVSGNYISDRPANCPAMECRQERTQSCNSSGGNCNTGTYRYQTRTSGNWSGWSSGMCPYQNHPVLSGPTVSGTSTRVTTTVYSMLNATELQNRICKYNVSGFNGSTTSGPNAYCPTIAILPLSDSPTTVANHVAAMVADGGTNIHEGTAWGMRVLSPVEPFTEGAPYDEATSKVLIVMTDGENTAYPANNMNWAAYYSAYGFPTNNRLGASGWTQTQLNMEMDRRLLETCRSAKNLGIAVYTIGLAVQQTSRPTEVRQMLTSCATQADYAYFPAHPTELNDVFSSIAQQLAALRISR
jgi:Flp pilus assembly protein TadG